MRREYWERRPVSARFRPRPPSTLDSVFNAAASMPERGGSDRFWMARGDAPKTRGDFAYIDLDLMGPHASDGGFDGFFARLADRPFGINIHRLGLADSSFLRFAKPFARELTDVPGAATANRWVVDTFFGTYPATPFGIHRDPASVFSFVLRGRRRYCFWQMDAFEPDDAALQKPDMDVINATLPRAEVFEAGPGDMVYWPSNRWHVMLSDGSPFVAAQVSAYFNRDDVGQ